MIGRRREGTLVVQTAYLGNVVLATLLVSAFAAEPPGSILRRVEERRAIRTGH
jgi:hypothetical protein